MREHHLAVERTARYVTLGESGAPRQVWFVCHGYGQLAPYFIRHFAPLDDGSRLIVAPEGLSRFYREEPAGGHGTARVGASWMTREDRAAEIADYVAYLDALYARVMGGIAGAGVVALGFSQGVATVARWVAAGRSRVGHLVLWAERVPPDLDLTAAAPVLRGLRLSLVAGRRDPAVPADAVEAEEERLRSAGIPVEVIRFDGAHELDPEVMLKLAQPGGGDVRA